MDLARHADTLRKRGLGICSISYDAVEVLRDFAERRGITYPMLADPDSKIIRKFGLLNESYPPGDRAYGVPYPVMFFVNPSGIITRKYAEEKYINRRTMATTLAEDMPATGLPVAAPIAGEQVTVQPLAAQGEVDPGNRFALYLEVTPRSGVHVYASGAGKGYRALTLKLSERPYFVTFAPTYPPADQMWSSPEDEQVPVYTSPARVKVEVMLGSRQDLQPVYEAGGTLRIEGVLTVQACSETLCWPPAELAVAWTLRLTPPDLERPPEQLQRERLLLKPSSSS